MRGTGRASTLSSKNITYPRGGLQGPRDSALSHFTKQLNRHAQGHEGRDFGVLNITL